VVDKTKPILKLRDDYDIIAMEDIKKAGKNYSAEEMMADAKATLKATKDASIAARDFLYGPGKDLEKLAFFSVLRSVIKGTYLSMGGFLGYSFGLIVRITC
jgi:hypothetical protein